MRNGLISEHGCGLWYATEEFDTTRNLCRACYTLYRRFDNRRRADKRRAAMLWAKFRITVEDYDRMREEQHYRCAVCNRHEDEITTRLGRKRFDDSEKFSGGVLVVDHCHDSNIVRRLLCSNCNSGLGYLQDSPEVVAAALRYLLEHQHLLGEVPRSRPMPMHHQEDGAPQGSTGC